MIGKIQATSTTEWDIVDAEQGIVDRSVPLLLKQPGGRRHLRFQGMAGPVDLSNVGSSNPDEWPLLDCLKGKDSPGAYYHDLKVHRVTISGGDKPLHPAWVRSIRDACEAAGVEFVFESWGKWEPYGDVNSTSLCSVRRMKWIGPNGEIFHGNVRPSFDYVLMKPVGRKHSGRTLDGREHAAGVATRSDVQGDQEEPAIE